MKTSLNTLVSRSIFSRISSLRCRRVIFDTVTQRTPRRRLLSRQEYALLEELGHRRHERRALAGLIGRPAAPWDVRFHNPQQALVGSEPYFRHRRGKCLWVPSMNREILRAQTSPRGSHGQLDEPAQNI